MSESSGNDNTGFGAVLILIVFIVFIFVIVDAIGDSIKASKFDKQFDAGAVKISSNYIILANEGSPSASSLPNWVPEGGSEILEHPRLYRIEKCEVMTLPENAEGVYATTPYFQPDVIHISVPQQTTGSVNVCVPQGTQIDVVLWAKVPKE